MPKPRAGDVALKNIRTWRGAMALIVVAVPAVVGVYFLLRGPSGPSVLLVTLDTTRAGRVGCYGYAAARTPTIDALAESGVRFGKAYCQVPLTLPSHTSLLTGTYPPTSGVRINGASSLGDEVPALAELFRSKGYRTAAFVAAPVLDAFFGLDRGFEVYDDDMEGREVEGAGVIERHADEVCDSALAWLDQHGQEPFFVWVHFFDPHDPYEPPASYRQSLSDPYDGEIAFADAQLGRLVDWLKGRKLDSTLIVVAGDHGEAFDEHEEFHHGLFVYETTMHVPLILSCPSTLPAGRVVEAEVGLVDVFPTVVELLGWEVPADVEGVSLASVCRTGRMNPRPVYGESEYPRRSYGWAALKSLTTDRWKYIDAPRAELYDRLSDPGELNNVIDREPSVVADLRGQLQTMVEGMVPHGGPAVAPDHDMLQRLESLGYVAGAASAEDEGAVGRDPKDMVAVYLGHLRAMGELRAGNCAAAAEILEPLTQQSPQSGQLFGALGKAYLALGRPRDAQRAFEASLKGAPHDPEKLCALGDAYRRQGQTAEAVEQYEHAVAAAPDFALAHNRLGQVYAGQGQFDRACEHLRRDVEINPTSPRALCDMGQVLVEVGRYEEAAEHFRQALCENPEFARAHRFLWRALAAGGDRLEAIGALRAACPALPEDLALKRELAGMLATTPQAGPGHVREAVRLAQECCESDAGAPESWDVLAVAYAAMGDFARAAETARRALSLAESQGRTRLARQIAGRLRAYQARSGP